MKGFEELINVERLWHTAREGTGRGVRVAILDTGIDAQHPAFSAAVRGCYEVVPAGYQLQCQQTEGGDHVGHGTACAGIIHNLAPEAELYSIRVIGNNAIGTIEQLVCGLRWAINQGFEIINLSLGTVQNRQVSVLHDLVDEAYFKGLFVVAAANNHRQVSYPAQFASLVAVDNQSFETPLAFNYRLGRPVELVANGIYVHAPSPGGKFRWFTGTSFACPHISGLVARLKSELPDLNPFQVKALLYCLRSNREQPPAEPTLVAPQDGVTAGARPD